ncbi:MAG: acyl-CoA dehydrogenase family protein [Candidatus Eisenbacteria bacterium]|nr:acyl-CoA dehydrogenase family protein [Candidatus Eisenbacteria bacterium]
MHFDLNDEQALIRKTVREFAEKTLGPTAGERDHHEKPAIEEAKAFADLGFLGMTIPEEYGGALLDDISEAIVIEELSRVDASFGVLVSVHTSLSATVVVTHGTDAQKKKYLPRLATGEILAAYSLSEAGAGSDPTALSCAAAKKGDKYVLNGEKMWVTNGSIADLYILMAKTDPSAPGAKGVSAFLIEKGFPGFSVGKKEEKLGIRSSDTVSLILQNCEVPAENLLWEEGKGMRIAFEALDKSRIGIAAQAVGIAQGAFDAALAYSKQREQFGRPIIQHQTIGNYLADMATRIEAARLLTYKAAYLKEKKAKHTMESAQAKLFAGDIAVWVADRAVQILGGYGYTREFPVERFYRDAKITQIYEGTNEIQRLVIARALVS